ncbi:hypothetical protein J1N35_027946 [Gossypium stocksii]|uniref:Uncharacterized protein n=1 Tax=Gossypium stocksii TaxID=47602 RepID=A0A9D4A0P3_9ROSI|nr:hypothetical protein J1N35_027946 [Gossypium stocksii]
MPLSTIISFILNIEAAKVPICLRMKRCIKRKKYHKLKRAASTRGTSRHGDDENETVLMLGERRRKGMIKSKVKVPLRKWRDAYVETMLSFAGRVAQLNNGNVYLLREFQMPKC